MLRARPLIGEEAKTGSGVAGATTGHTRSHSSLTALATTGIPSHSRRKKTGQPSRRRSRLKKSRGKLRSAQG